MFNHDDVVARIANHLDSKGYSVNADVTGFDSPMLIPAVKGSNCQEENYIPDLVAYQPGYQFGTLIIEVETEMSSNHTICQLKAFSFRAQSEAMTELIIIAPEDVHNEGTLLMMSNGIKGKLLTPFQFETQY